MKLRCGKRWTHYRVYTLNHVLNFDGFNTVFLKWAIFLVAGAAREVFLYYDVFVPQGTPLGNGFRAEDEHRRQARHACQVGWPAAHADIQGASFKEGGELFEGVNFTRPDYRLIVQ